MKKVLIASTIFIALSLTSCFDSKKQISVQELLNAPQGVAYEANFYSVTGGTSIADYENTISKALKENLIGIKLTNTKKPNAEYKPFYFYRGPSGPASGFSWFDIYFHEDGYMKVIYGRDAKLASYSQTDCYQIDTSIIASLNSLADSRYTEIKTAYDTALEQARINGDITHFLSAMENETERKLDVYIYSGPKSVPDYDGAILNDLKELNYVKTEQNLPNPTPALKYYHDYKWTLTIYSGYELATLYYEYEWKYDKNGFVTYYSINKDKVEALINKLN